MKKLPDMKEVSKRIKKNNKQKPSKKKLKSLYEVLEKEGHLEKGLKND